MLKVIGWLLVAFSIVDLALFYICDIDLTGVSWSPWVVGTIGYLLIEFGDRKNNEEETTTTGESE